MHLCLYVSYLSHETRAESFSCRQAPSDRLTSSLFKRTTIAQSHTDTQVREFESSVVCVLPSTTTET